MIIEKELLIDRIIKEITKRICDEAYTTGIFELANYPKSFSMDEFKNIKTFSGRVKYCDSKLQRLGSGSSRIAYKVDNGTVLKLAKNRKGLAQNETEVDVCYNRFSNCVAKVFDFDENYLWIEMQLARRAKKSDFKNITGKDFDFFCGFVDYVQYQVAGNRYKGLRDETKDALYDGFIESDEYEYSFYSELWDYMANYNITVIGDLKRISSWGVAINDDGSQDLLLIDAGLNDTVYNNYYKLS